ncbi:MAG: bifunctional oligoribonuclease/PAP phosphatase NrnA [Balneolia bacterium]|nr:bifunctional oligoribonuclease/PAP phosphatase NrnA [Balneolia bacterium]
MYDYQEDIHELVRQLRKHRKIGVISHVRPDGDAIGSQVGMCLWLESEGIEYLAHNDDPLPDDIGWIANGVEIRPYSQDELETCEALLFVDGNSPKRFGNHSRFFEEYSGPAYVIDHHPDPASGYSFMVSEPEAASTAELVYWLYDETAPDRITKEVATALYTGIMTDTGSFRFSSVGSHIHRIIADLIDRGRLKIAPIHQKVFDNRELRQLKLISRVLDQIEVYDKHNMASMVVTLDDLESTGCDYNDTEGLISFPLSLSSVDVAIIFIEREGKIKLSLRSKTDFDVNLLARKFQGGGHQKAAGAWYDGTIGEAVSDVMKTAFEMAVKPAS